MSGTIIRVFSRSLTVVFLLVLFSAAQKTEAALLYLDPPELAISRGDSVTLSLRLATDQDECVNTFDVVVGYGDSIRAVDVSLGKSIINVWLEQPRIDEEKRTITFAGGIPGGYCGRIPGDPSLTNVLAELIFRSPGFSIGASGATEPVAQVTIDAELSQVLLHDGLGTRAPLRTENATLTLLDTPGSAVTDDWRTRVADDNEPPADFTISLDKDDTAFSGKYFVTFGSTDKQSGINHYEIMEESIEDIYSFNWGRADAPWVRAESPYVLQDQTLNSTIRVRAIDKAGNQTIAVLVPDEALRTLSRDRIIFLSVLGLGVVLLTTLIGFIVYRRKKHVTTHYADVNE